MYINFSSRPCRLPIKLHATTWETLVSMCFPLYLTLFVFSHSSTSTFHILFTFFSSALSFFSLSLSLSCLFLLHFLFSISSISVEEATRQLDSEILPIHFYWLLEGRNWKISSLLSTPSLHILSIYGSTTQYTSIVHIHDSPILVAWKVSLFLKYKVR